MSTPDNNVELSEELRLSIANRDATIAASNDLVVALEEKVRLLKAMRATAKYEASKKA